MLAPAPFAPVLFRFMRDLRKNNDREWFLAHKERFERDVKEPALRFIAAFAPALRRISPHLVADLRPVGGSFFRIQRDIRSGVDKRPYKTYVGIHFRLGAAEGPHAPGLYLHLEPGDVFAGAGIWEPDGAVLSELRDAIAASPAAYRRAVGARSFSERFSFTGESLVRVPRGYDADHPCAGAFKRKSHIAIAGFSERDACADDFPDRLERTWRASAPLMRFLTQALGLPF